MSQPYVFSPYDFDEIQAVLTGTKPALDIRDPHESYWDAPKRVNFEGAAIASVFVPEGVKLVIFKPTNDTHKMAAEFMDSEIFACVKDVNGEFEPTASRILIDMVYERGNDVMILTLESIAP